MTRIVLLGVAALLLLVGGVALWPRPHVGIGTRPARAEAPDREVARSVTDLRRPEPLPESSQQESAPSEDPAPSTAVALDDTGPGAVDDPVQCLVYGRVTEPDGDPVVAPWAWVTFVDEHGEKCNTRPNAAGKYSMTGLHPGTWWVRVTAGSYRALEEELRLVREEPVVRRDFTLVPAVLVKVKTVTPEGQQLYEAIRAAGVRVGELVPVATREAPGDRFYGVVGSLNNKFGVGSFRESGSLYGILPAGYCGVIEIDGDLPVYVSLVLHHAVLETKRVDPPADEVEFVIAVETIAANLATIRLELVDAETSAPLPGVRVTLPMTSGMSSVTGADGVAVLEKCDPGRHTIDAAPAGYERFSREIDAQPGVVTDLGRIALGKETWIEGRVVDDAGQPLSTRLRLGTIGRDGFTADKLRTFISDKDGRIRIDGLSRGAYVLTTEGDDEVSIPGSPQATAWVSGNVRVDTFAGPVENLEIRLVRPTIVSVQPPPDWKSSRFTITDESGLWLRRQGFWSGTPMQLKLPPGNYHFTLTDGTGRVLAEQDFTVASDPLALPSAETRGG